MANSFLLKPSIKLNPLTHQYPLITQLSPIIPFLPISPNFSRLITNPKLTQKCSVTSKKPILELAKSETISNPFKIVANALLKSLKPLQEHAVSAVFFIVLASLYFPKSALAASGGRMGRSSFSSRSSSSSRGSSSSSSSSRSSSSSSSDDGSFVLSIFLHLVLFVIFAKGNPARMTSVIKLQVGLLGSARSLQRDLNRIAETADTSTNEGLTYILSETTSALLRHPDYCISGYSSVDVKDMVDVETLFNSISIEERGKIDEETLVNSNNIKKKSTISKESTGINNEYIVITILVAAKGVYTMPTVSSIKELKDAMNKLSSISTNKRLAVEVLWTPQEENDILTEQEMLDKYPHLHLFK